MTYYTDISGEITEIITLAQAKKQLRVDAIVDHEDDLILEYIAEAREIAENYIGRYIAERTLEISYTDYITNFEFTPVTEIDSIKCMVDGNQTTLPVEKYKLVQVNQDKQRLLYTTTDLPVLDVADNAVVVTVKVGYKKTKCPKAIVSAMKLILTRLYNFREDSPEDKQKASFNILRKYKKWA